MKMTRAEYEEKLKKNEELWRSGNGIGYYEDYVNAQRNLKDEYIESLEEELNRVAGFLAIHHFPGYSISCEDNYNESSYRSL